MTLIDLTTNSPTLQRIILEEYSGKIFPDQCHTNYSERDKSFSFSRLEKDRLYVLLINNSKELTNEDYLIQNYKTGEFIQLKEKGKTINGLENITKYLSRRISQNSDLTNN